MTTPRDDIDGLSERLREWLGHVHSLKSRLSSRSRSEIFYPGSLAPELLRRSEEMLEEVIEHGREAYVAIDSLLKERDELRAYADELFRENGIVRDMLLNPNPDQEPDNVRLHREKCDAIDRALRAEQERDALQARVKELDVQNLALRALVKDGDDVEEERDRAQSERDSMLKTKRSTTRRAQDFYTQMKVAESRALRAEQERDEAYERLKPFSDIADEMLSRGWDASNIALTLDNPDDPHRVTAGDFFAARDLVRRLAAGPEKEK